MKVYGPSARRLKKGFEIIFYFFGLQCAKPADIDWRIAQAVDWDEFTHGATIDLVEPRLQNLHEFRLTVPSRVLS